MDRIYTQELYVGSNGCKHIVLYLLRAHTFFDFFVISPVFDEREIGIRLGIGCGQEVMIRPSVTQRYKEHTAISQVIKQLQ